MAANRSTNSKSLTVPRNEEAGIVAFSPRALQHAKVTGDLPKIFQHVFLTDVSGKGEIFEKIDFSYSVFVRGYFHQAKFISCKFAGTRFTDCNFRNAEFKECDFRYADLNGTRIETDEMLGTLPDEPNIRRELLQILRKNALSLGDVASARRFVLAEIAAKREHLRRAWNLDGVYYKRKYSGGWNKVIIGFKRAGFWADSFLWGHGERLWKLGVSVTVLLILASIASVFVWAGGQDSVTWASLRISFMEYATYYLALFLDVPLKAPSYHWFWLDSAVIVARYLTFGVLVAGLFRWLSHR